jgi:biopolymer transport protein ExbB/TolQ
VRRDHRLLASQWAGVHPAGRSLSRAEVIELTARSMERSSAEVSLKMKRYLSGLATVASTAPFIGMFGTVIGILDAFKGCIGSRWFCTVAVIDGVCEALVTTVLALLVAIPSVWFYNYLSRTMELFDIEMKNASLELQNYLAIHSGARPQSDREHLAL